MDTFTALIEEGYTLVTPNNRLALHILRHYVSRIHQTTIEKPAIYPYQTWLNTLYQEGITHGYLPYHYRILSRYQTESVWTMALQAHQLSEPYPFLSALTDAYILTTQYTISLTHPDFSDTHQTQLFKKLAEQVNQYLKNHACIHDKTLDAFLIPFLSDFTPRKIAWICFDNKVAIQHHFIDSTPHFSHLFVDLTTPEGQLATAISPTIDSEYDAILSMIETALKKNHQSIGIIAPNPNDLKHTLVERIQKQFKLSVNLSEGQPLSHYPLIRDALHLLTLPNYAIPDKTREIILTSPFITHNENDFIKRHQCLIAHPINDFEPIQLSTFVDMLALFDPMLSNQIKTAPIPMKKATSFEWRDFFSRYLLHFSFANTHPLSSENYQLHQQWHLLLNKFATEPLTNTHWSYHDALATLTTLAKQTAFQPEAKTTPIELLGLLEAQGRYYDTLIVMSMTHEALPAKGRLNPFIPITIQKKQSLPFANPIKEQKLAYQYFNRLKKMGKYVFFTSYLEDKDRHVEPHPLIVNLPYFTPSITALSTQSALTLKTASYQIESNYIQLDKLSASFMQTLIDCPLKAYFKYCLKYQAPETQDTTLSPLDKGNCLHDALFLFWQTIPSQAALRELSDDACQAHIASVASKAISKHIKQSHATLQTFMQAVEYEKLVQQLKSMVTFELSRPPFTIHALEHAFTITIDETPFHLRADRIDETPEGDLIIIDYKSTLPTEKDWFTARPSAAQLILYQNYHPTVRQLWFYTPTIQSVELNAIGDIHATGIDFISIPKQCPDWDTLTKQWKDQLTLALKQFKSGDVRPNPRKEGLCERCEYTHICTYRK